ncbi:MAG TPA: hypothetical protein DEP47_13525 [Chloroflexi bacterium]|nr:hypothetical protein [Chloroflexota bacterium]
MWRQASYRQFFNQNNSIFTKYRKSRGLDPRLPLNRSDHYLAGTRPACGQIWFISCLQNESGPDVTYQILSMAHHFDERLHDAFTKPTRP